MLIWDRPEIINTYVGDNGGGYCAPGTFSALGWARDGEIVAGLVFYDCNGSHCLVNIAITGKRFPPGLLKAGLFYVFSQIKLKRLTFLIEEVNLPSQNLVTRLGAIPEATLRDAGKTGNMLIYALFPEDCTIWSRINGKRRGYPNTTRSD